VREYHDGTKHHFHQFARSLGYLDWAAQPRPFRAFRGAPEFALYPSPSAARDGYAPRAVTYADLFEADGGVVAPGAGAIGDLIRHALGLSAWKRLGAARWALRVNPSSGNLHPTEAYVICGASPGLGAAPAVYHYAADRHVLEARCAFAEGAWARAYAGSGPVMLIALTSIHWREAWKYGERAFRYCQHDVGHAIAAVGLAARLHGWRARLLPEWSHRDIAALTGIDRDEDFVDAEREEPACLMAIDSRAAPSAVERMPSPAPCGPTHADRERFVEAVRAGRWSGRASQLSEDHVEWTFIDRVARATEDEGRPDVPPADLPPATDAARTASEHDARALILRRRSALDFDGRSTMARQAFFDMLSRVMPRSHAPWNILWWTPRIHLAIFVHRVDGVAPGVYLLAREARAIDRLRAACTRELLWEAAHEDLPFVRLARGDYRRSAARLSCDQAIAADGFFSLAMIADFDGSLAEHGASFYRHLFWESGVVGQVLYLEAEAAGARATGIGCFYDDPVHDVLGLADHAFQSLYHFTAGMPVEDARLTTEPGYTFERPAAEI
jgi:SagB-type dehydrogenase family enzyme